MSNERTLVFGDDGSPASDIVWLFINSHAWPAWRLEVVTAQAPAQWQARSDDTPALREWESPHPRHEFAEAGFSEVAHLTSTDDPRLVLSRKADLIAIGPKGPGLLKSLHLGSTADWLLLHPPAPLLIARHGRPVRRVVLCTDGSTHAQRVTKAVADLPWASELDITILAIDDHRVDADEATRLAREQLEPVARSIDVRIQQGKPTPVILGLLEETSADLVALGTRGLTGLRHLRLGSTASAITRGAACSVLVACEEDDAPTSSSSSS